VIRYALIVGMLIGSVARSNSKLDARLADALQLRSADEPIAAWVFFTDKGTHELGHRPVPHSVVSPRAITRRLKVRPLESVVDNTDLPVDERYVAEVSARVVRVRQRSKWFNGVSVLATRSQLEHVAELPFVRRLELVARFRKNDTERLLDTPQPASPQTLLSPSRTHVFDYGPSFGQLNLMNVPAVHDRGNYGQGVIIGVFDNGFRLLHHEAFDTLRTRIVATYDFVDHKVSVVPNNPSTGFGAHGVVTLSALGGFKQGQLIGPAFGASYILARTENDSSETPLEEDNWVAAIEWADSIGVDVTSTSLGYLTYDPPFPSWTWQNMDGNTTVITRAADMAVARGIVVCNSAGNNGFSNEHNTLNAPADGDSVLAIGAVSVDGQRASFSSVGPTVDGRIKPDLMAQGVTVRCAHWDNPTQYTYSGGTSLSCPLAAGVAALLLHARPSATPMEIASLMKATASRANAPDNLYGWGIPDADRALSKIVPTRFALFQNYPNPFNAGTTLEYMVPEPAHVTIKVFDLLGREVRTLVNEATPSAARRVTWDGRNAQGNSVATGVYFARMVAAASSGKQYKSTIKMMLVR
jgi:serine protease AprX